MDSPEKWTFFEVEWRKEVEGMCFPITRTIRRACGSVLVGPEGQGEELDGFVHGWLKKGIRQ
jgi:hypothetical protein